MSERKAINKYYPPDWDPSKVPKKKKNTNPNAEKVRLMVPFSMKCLQCSEYISSRRKFNARKEITNEKYMGIKIIKFHIKCPRCNFSLSFQTDPKSAGFIPVAGCTRNYESLSTTEAIKPLETEDEILERLERQEKEDQQFQEQQQKRKNNPFWSRQTSDSSKDIMSNLEDKLIEQKREQEVHDHLLYLQAKANKLQQSGGEDHLVNHAQQKLRVDLKRDREDDDLAPQVDQKVNETPHKNTEIESKVIPTVPGSFTVRKAKIRKLNAVDSGATRTSADTELKSSSVSKSKESSPQSREVGSIFGNYDSSEEE